MVNLGSALNKSISRSRISSTNQIVVDPATQQDIMNQAMEIPIAVYDLEQPGGVNTKSPDIIG